MPELTLATVVFRAAGFLIVAGVHGFVLAALVTALGDAGPRQDGRLTLNPFAHLDVLGALGAIGLEFGWIRPLEIDPARLRSGRVAQAACALVAIAAVLGLGIVLQYLRPLALTLLPGSAGLTAATLIETTTHLCICFALFNLIPLPPLTGAHFLTAALPWLREGAFRRRARTFAPVVMLVVAFLAGGFLRPICAAVAAAVLWS